MIALSEPVERPEGMPEFAYTRAARISIEGGPPKIPFWGDENAIPGDMIYKFHGIVEGSGE